MDALTHIKTCDSLEFLIEMRDKFIPMDYEGLETNSIHVFTAKMFQIPLDKYIEDKRKGIKIIENAVNERISQLNNIS